RRGQTVRLVEAGDVFDLASNRGRQVAACFSPRFRSGRIEGFGVASTSPLDRSRRLHPTATDPRECAGAGEAVAASTCQDISADPSHGAFLVEAPASTRIGTRQ